MTISFLYKFFFSNNTLNTIKMNEQTNLVSINELTLKQIASICDHTFLNRSEAYKKIAEKGQSPVKLRAEAFNSFLEETISDEEKLPYAVCVRPEDVATAVNYFAEKEKEEVLIASVVGFPDGSLYDPGFKVLETEVTINRGAKEIDMVINYDKLKAGDIDYVEDEVYAVVSVAHDEDVLVKLILETSELDKEQIKKACDIANETGVDFVKTSTGFSAYGARTEDLAIMRKYFNKGVKISGGVKPENFRELLFAASGRADGYIRLSPDYIRIGESSLLRML